MRASLMSSALVFALAACGGGGYGSDAPTNPNNPYGPMNPGGGGTANAVTVQDNSFVPSSTTISVGSTVTWTWTGYNTHNVTFDDGSATSGDKTSGTYQRTFNTAGTFAYRCTIHGAAMSGTVVVQ